MNLSTLHKSFGTKAKCIAYLEKLRWGKTPGCVLCGAMNVRKRKDTIKWHCNSCNSDYTVLYGTIFEGSKLQLPKWFEIVMLMANSPMGVAAKEIERNVGVTYKTAWYAAHRTRCAMIDNELRLQGVVEFDESYFGGKKKKIQKFDENKASLSRVTQKRGRGTAKVPAVGAVEKKGKVYVKIIEKLTGRNLLAMLKQIVNTDDSVAITDGFKGYKSFDSTITRIAINKSKQGYGKGSATINTIEGFWSIIQNGIKGNYRAISKKYLPFYLAEFSFKYNNRKVQADSFFVILANAVKDEKCFTKYKPKKEPKEIVYRCTKQK
jgi:transposase-like protein